MYESDPPETSAHSQQKRNTKTTNSGDARLVRPAAVGQERHHRHLGDSRFCARELDRPISFIGGGVHGVGE